MTTGLIFDIREFAIHDGPGIRTTVFFKGCPLNCAWCHNPEGQSCMPQVMQTPRGQRVVGKEYSPSKLAAYLNDQALILRLNEGGVTFSGGEPLMQAPFIHATLDLLDPNLHCLLDTSGYAPAETFRKLVQRVHLVYIDLKLMDPQAHLHYTGQSNAPTLQNLNILSETGVPFVVRVPMIPTITDTDENLAAIAEYVYGLPGLLRVDLLPYNKLAGAKYPAFGLNYFLHSIENYSINLTTDPFTNRGVEVLIQ